MIYFFSPHLPADSQLYQKYRELVLKYPDINKYLYITTLQKILFSLSDLEQKELIMALESSEELAQKWLKKHQELTEVMTEHLERNILATYAQLS